MADINLLPDQTGEDKQKLHQQQLTTKVSVIALILTIVVVAGLFGTNFWLNNQIGNTNDQIDVQANRIQQKKTDEAIIRSLDGKLTTLSTFLVSQKHYSTFLNQFVKTMPESVRLTDLSVTEANAVTITGATTSYADLAGFYDKLRQAGSDADQPYFANPVLTAISRDAETGSITFSMAFSLTLPDTAGAQS
jgi:Tfp pilus assembly protein PilN